GLRPHDRASWPPKESSQLDSRWAESTRHTSARIHVSVRIPPCHLQCCRTRRIRGPPPAPRTRRKECLRTDSRPRLRCTLPDSCSATSVVRQCSSTKAQSPDNSSRPLLPLLPSSRRSRALHSASHKS